MTLVVLATFAVQCAEAVLLAAVLLSFYRLYRRGYLLLWSLSWWALCVSFLCGGLGLWAAAQHIPSSSLFRLVVAAAGLVAGYWQVVWLLLGTGELASGRRVGRRRRRVLLALAAAVGIAGALAFAWSPGAASQRFLMRVGVKSLLVGGAFIAASVGVWRSRRPAALGHVLVSGAFGLYGLEQLHYLGIAVWELVTQKFTPYGPFLGFIDFFLQLAMGLGMVVWLLEEERARVIKASERIDFLAHYDPLTGLPNRQLFMNLLGVAVESAQVGGRGLALACMDVDRFQVVNSTLGHGSGDELLRSLGQRLQMAIGEGGLVARLGEDEFALLFEVGDGPAGVSDTLDRVLRVVRRPFALHRRDVFLTVSAGVALCPDHAGTTAALLRAAEAAVRAVRGRGRDAWACYQLSMETTSGARLDLEGRLRRAVEDNELVLHYQPIVAVSSGRVVALEALVRWEHPRDGLLMPVDFLGIASAIGLLGRIEAWVLDEGCRQLRAWQEMGFTRLKLAVNLSAGRFQDPGLVARVQEVLARSGVGPGDLQLEITESTAMHRAEATLEVLRQLKEVGVEIAIDDFGTGYSSLSYLGSFPVDLLKIDRSFVRNLAPGSDEEALISAIIALAHSLRLPVVAEGVESMEQRQLLERHGCEYLQGHLIARALPPRECAALLLREEGRAAGS